MRKQIAKSFTELVELKYQLYNSLFLTLPLDAVEQTGLLLPLLQEYCEKGYANGESPTNIIDHFFKEHKPYFTERERISFLFKVIQYVERQIVLIDALEEAAYHKIHNLEETDVWEDIKKRILNNDTQRLNILSDSFGVRVVLTAHPTQFYPGRVLAITSDITDSIIKGDVALTRDLLMQLGKTPFYRKKKPTALDEANSLIWYLANIFYPSIGKILDKVTENLPQLESAKLITLGFWPGGDRDGNPFVTVETTRKVAMNLRSALVNGYINDIKNLKRRLSFPGVYEILNQIDDLLNIEITHADGDRNADMHEIIQKLDDIEALLVKDHQSLFLDKFLSFKRKVKLFGFHFASIDIRQDSRIISKAFNAVVENYSEVLPQEFNEWDETEQLIYLLNFNKALTIFKIEDAVIKDTLESFGVIREIQAMNGEPGAHRFIISNCRGALDIARVIFLARVCAWGDKDLSLDVVPLFETVDDLKEAGQTMEKLYTNAVYRQHLCARKNQQTIMLGFSDGTKDGGYLMANWSIFTAKENITKVSRENNVEVMFFDGRGGPPARGGGNAHLFYGALGKTVESKQIQMTVQGQTISSHYGIIPAAMHNLSHLLAAGIENNLFDNPASELDSGQRDLLGKLSEKSFVKYSALKNHELFVPFLEERSTIKYYGMTNIGSRPSKRGAGKKLNFDDLRAIPFVGAWSQLKQNVPGFFGVGTALKEQEEAGNLQACIELYQQSTFFKTLIANSMQSMSKTNFEITRYMASDEKYGAFWQLIYNEFLLSKQMVLKVSGYTELLADNPRSRMSIKLRERIVLPLLTIQQHALIKVQNQPDGEFLSKYERMVMRSLFGNINASRNSV